jgi:hypothetical protein
MYFLRILHRPMRVRIPILLIRKIKAEPIFLRKFMELIPSASNSGFSA